MLVPHDATEKSDKALGRAIYLSNLSGVEIIILNVIEHVKKTESSALIAISKSYGLWWSRNDGGRKNKIM